MQVKFLRISEGSCWLNHDFMRSTNVSELTKWSSLCPVDAQQILSVTNVVAPAKLAGPNTIANYMSFIVMNGQNENFKFLRCLKWYCLKDINTLIDLFWNWSIKSISTITAFAQAPESRTPHEETTCLWPDRACSINSCPGSTSLFCRPQCPINLRFKTKQEPSRQRKPYLLKSHKIFQKIRPLREKPHQFCQQPLGAESIKKFT